MKIEIWLKILIVVLIVLAFFVGSILFPVPTKKTISELTRKDFGLPDGYSTPIVVQDWSGRQIMTLYPTGRIIRHEPVSDEMIIRIMISENIAVMEKNQTLDRLVAPLTKKGRELTAENARLKAKVKEQAAGIDRAHKLEMQLKAQIKDLSRKG